MSKQPLIAIVDDDLSIRAGIEDLLRSAGFHTSTFDSAESFLDSAASVAAACLVTDLRMRGMNGLELHHRLVATGRMIPTILITAHRRELTEGRAREAGIRFYLTKPFTPDELLECARAALGRTRVEGYP